MKPKAHEFIQANLKRGQMVEEKDKAIFQRYSRGKLHISDAKILFMRNNRFNERDFGKLSDEDFAEWLRSIGWGRLG